MDKTKEQILDTYDDIICFCIHQLQEEFGYAKQIEFVIQYDKTIREPVYLGCVNILGIYALLTNSTIKVSRNYKGYKKTKEKLNLNKVIKYTLGSANCDLIGLFSLYLVKYNEENDTSYSLSIFKDIQDEYYTYGKEELDD